MCVPRVPQYEINGKPHSTLVLGTSQLGMKYGWANTTGCPSEEEAILILKKAIELGVTHVDTARAYGESEQRIGLVMEKGYHNVLNIITKLDPLESLPLDAAEDWVRAAVDASVFHSCRDLRKPHLDVLLLHRASHLDNYRRSIWKRLCELKEQGVIGELGVSVQSLDEAKRALVNPDVRYIQIPFNILDRRWLEFDFQNLLKTRPDVIVHARSLLLQGVLTIEDPSEWPQVPRVEPLKIILKLRLLAKRFRRRDVIDLALAYARGQKWLHGFVVGVETVEQLIDIAKLMSTAPLTSEECKVVEDNIPGGPEMLVNPALWPPKRNV
ncbi:MAG: aldo/keto reductase [Candidatus Bilamarchaeaceae archaeon]